MTHQPTPPSDRPEADQYEIRIAGHLDSHWSAWFDGMTVGHASDGTTVISGPITDQAALHGLLHRVRDMGVPLISVRRVDPDLSDHPTTEAR